MKKFTLATLTLLFSASVLRAQIDVEQALAIGRNAIYFNDYIVSMGYFNQIIELASRRRNILHLSKTSAVGLSFPREM